MAQHLFGTLRATLSFDDPEAAQPVLGGLLHIWRNAPRSHATLIETLKQPENRPVQTAIVEWHQSLHAKRKAEGVHEHALPDSDEAVLADMILPLLELREIHSDTVSAETLQGLFEGEAVHDAPDIETLRRTRLSPSTPPAEGGVWDKHCYGLFLPWEDVPGTVIYTHLADRAVGNDGTIDVHDLADNVETLLTREPVPVKHPNNMTLYSVSNLKNGKPNGFPLQETLLQRLVAAHNGTELSPHVPRIDSLTSLNTLSPIPKFHEWLEARLKAQDPKLLAHREQRWLLSIARRIPGQEELDNPFKAALLLSEQIPADAKTHVLEGTGGHTDLQTLRLILKDLALEYLMNEKSRKNPNAPRCTVANTHWSKGAMLGDIKVGANMQPKGIERSYTVMANHVYGLDLGKMQERAESYKAGHITTTQTLQQRYEARQAEKARDHTTLLPPPPLWKDRRGDAAAGPAAAGHGM